MDKIACQENYALSQDLPQVKQLFSILKERPERYECLLRLFLSQNANQDIMLEMVVENQRGIKFFGIPLFSTESLIPVLDPSGFQTIEGKSLGLSYNTLDNYILPDLDWEWMWPTWRVLMLDDVDDDGWTYSSILFKQRSWKGKYRVGKFVRRRVWVRMRKRKTQNDLLESTSNYMTTTFRPKLVD